MVWALPVSLAATKGMPESFTVSTPKCQHSKRPVLLVSFPPGTEMFHFPGYASRRKVEITEVYSDGFPHSEISGSKVARHLPEAYRSHATSFIAS